MKIAKDGVRSIVRIGYDGRVHKTFRGTGKKERFANEVRVLRILEARGCEFVPRVLEADEETLELVTTNCGSPAPQISKDKAEELFTTLEETYGVVHDDPFPRNITYHRQMGKFCVIDFELAKVLERRDGEELTEVEQEQSRILDWCGLTRAGHKRKGNQDSLSVFASDQGWARSEERSGSRSIDEEALIFAVSDGMGGAAGGDIASNLVVSELRRFLPAMMGDFSQVGEPTHILESAVKSLHEYVNRMAHRHEGMEEMGATVVCGLFFRHWVYFAHVGDSRFYRYHGGTLKQLTFDQTYVGAQFRAGKLNEREARSHPARNILNQAIGGLCQSVHPQVDEAPIEKGDWFLICSDGVIDGMWNKNLADAFARGVEQDLTAEQVATGILEDACEVSGRDDTTLFVIKVL